MHNPRILTDEETSAIFINTGLRELQGTADRGAVEEDDEMPSALPRPLEAMKELRAAPTSFCVCFTASSATFNFF